MRNEPRDGRKRVVFRAFRKVTSAPDPDAEVSTAAGAVAAIVSAATAVITSAVVATTAGVSAASIAVAAVNRAVVAGLSDPAENRAPVVIAANESINGNDLTAAGVIADAGAAGAAVAASGGGGGGSEHGEAENSGEEGGEFFHDG
jgi:hypothetical protein